MARLKKWDEAAFARLVADEIVQPLTDEVLARAQQTCPVRGGELARSLRSQVEVTSSKVTGAVYTDVEYAPYVHEGRGPIEAAPGRVLGPLPAPYPRFVRRVGPAEGQPWLREALEAARSWLR